MAQLDVHHCECPNCQQEAAHPDQQLHRQMNLLLSRLDEQQRRWYVAVESNRIGVGGDQLLSQITGLDQKRFNVGGRNWRPRWRIDQSSGCACLAVVALAQKKRPVARKHAASIGGAGDGR